MSQTQQISFSCSACGRKYPWKPELAGKKGKCKCGQIITAPAKAPQPAQAPAPAAPAPVSVPDATPGVCPSCAAILDEGAVLCVSCGYNLQTGGLVATQVEDAPLPAPPPTAAPAQAPELTPYPRSKPRNRKQEHASGGNKPLIAGVALLLLVAALIVGGKYYLKGNREPEKPLLGEDATALRMLKDDNPIEANAYLDAHESYKLGLQWNKRQGHYRVNEWYRMGAKKVWAFTAVICKSVVLELPPEPEKREELFKWAKQWNEDHLQPPQKDVGQKYLIITLMN